LVSVTVWFEAWQRGRAVVAQLLLVAIVVGSSWPARAQFTPAPAWFDEFSCNGSPDPAKWGFDKGGGGWGNNELEYYTARLENARVQDGTLIINALAENFGGCAYTSARLHSQGGGNFTYARIEVRARCTGAPGTWPAIWLLPTYWVYGTWPNSGEIDMMEHVISMGSVSQTSVHTKDYNFTIGTAQTAQTAPYDFGNWHTYRLEWFPHRLDMFLDNTKYFSFHDENAGASKWPFDQAFHLMLNVAVGGWGGLPGFTNETMEIDYVRVYPYTGQPALALNPTNWFRIVNRHSGKALDVAAPCTADGANIRQWDWANGLNQQWRFEAGGDGAYKLIARESNKACEVAGASWVDGANVQQGATNGAAAQEWWVLPAGGASYKILNRETGRTLVVQNFGMTNGANVQQCDYADTDNQQWRIEVLDGAPPAPAGVSGVPGDGQATLFWTPVAGATSYNVKRAGKAGGPYTVVASELTRTNFTDTPGNGATWFYVVSSLLASSEGTDSPPLAVTPAPLPWPWQSQDVGAVGLGGGATFNNGTFTATASGADISGAADEFRFVYKPIAGDGSIVARVVTLQNTDPWAKAGVMIRETLGAGAKHATMALTAGHGALFGWRATNGGGSSCAAAAGGAAAPFWIKLARTNTTITGYRSADGSNWTQTGSATVTMASNAFAGLVLSAHNDAALTVAVFDGVTASPQPALPLPLVAMGSVWKYSDVGADLGSAWRTRTYDDSTWPGGPAPLGFGSGNAATLVASNRQMTTYFRRTFTVGDLAAITNLVVRVLRNDGAVVYLNNTEVFRSNLPGGPVGYLTPALTAAPAGDATTNFYSTNVSAALLVAGTNLLAVEIHQNIATSSEVSFDLALAGCGGLLSRPPLVVVRRGGEIRLRWPASGAFRLYSSPCAAAPNPWSRECGLAVFTNGQWEWPIPRGASNRLYLLKAD
jgi:beta-glucanase (GH16 family)